MPASCRRWSARWLLRVWRRRLELEITETILLQDSETTLAMLYQLRELGVRIAMDDFGTGYSSLSYLQSFPFDRIKIDRSFIKDIADGVGSLNIVRAVAALAKGLGMETTAEGVETEQQRDKVAWRAAPRCKASCSADRAPHMKSSSSIFQSSGKSRRRRRRTRSPRRRLSLRAQALDKLECGIGVGRQSVLHLRRLDAGACGSTDLAVDLADFEAAPHEELLQLLDLLQLSSGIGWLPRLMAGAPARRVAR